jgi:hypothetical protein
MNVTRILSDYLEALTNVRIAFRAPSVLVPFLLFGLLQIVVLTLLASFPAPALAPVMVPVMRVLGGEAALHYPTHFAMLPEIFRRVYVPLVAVAGFAMWTFGVWSMVDHNEVGLRIPRRSRAARLADIIVIGIVFTGATVLLGRAVAIGSRLLPASVPAGAVAGVGIALVAAVQTLLVYAPVVIRLRGVHAPAAIVTSARYAWHNFGATALVVATVLVVSAPLDFLLANSDRIVFRFHPETVFHLLLASIALEVVTAYVLFAGVVGLALPEEGGLR